MRPHAWWLMARSRPDFWATFLPELPLHMVHGHAHNLARPQAAIKRAGQGTTATLAATTSAATSAQTAACC
ncbi:hypothetical protein ABZ835_33905 [Streptomyces sp. NPDC047461]|uniref:hypothetical protein n=1 Tax=Streptomyces sp. NPDC047461 TaxID=3155619 RepID=UPI0033F5A20A